MPATNTAMASAMMSGSTHCTSTSAPPIRHRFSSTGAKAGGPNEPKVFSTEPAAAAREISSR